MLNVHESSSIKSNLKTICWHGSGSGYIILTYLTYVGIYNYHTTPNHKIEVKKLAKTSD